MINPRRQFAVALAKQPQAQKAVILRYGIIAAVTAPTFTVTIDEVDIAGVRTYTHVTGLAVGNVVELLVVGSDVRILGRLG